VGEKGNKNKRDRGEGKSFLFSMVTGQSTNTLAGQTASKRERKAGEGDKETKTR
jgi:hypothetical protein